MPKTIQSCLTSQVLEQIERNDVSPDELIAIEEHVSECPRCREQFDRHYTSSQWSELIQPALSDAQVALTSVTEDGADHSAAILKLLGPTDDPNMLGRIGNYEIVGVIGQGGMGAVFKGFDRSLIRFVAIKMLLPHLAASGAARKRFAREGQAVAAVVDDHVMAIHCVDQWQGIPYLVMTYSRGVSLQKRLNDSGPLELREILRIGMQAAKGLAAAHAQGIVHRDIKPSNILLDQNVERVQLVDFGLARAVDDASLTCSGTLAGTPQYMSPEQSRAETVDHRSDLFSLGSVLYAMCAGYAPFRADSSYSVLRLIIEKEPRSIREINSDIPDWLCAIIGKLMAKQAVDRFDSAKQVAELLETCLAHVQQPTTVPLPSSIADLALLGSSASEFNQPQQAPTSDPKAKTWRRFIGPPISNYLAAALVTAAMVLAGVVIVLELDKGTLTIKSVADNVPIRILQGKDTVQELTVSKQGTTTRLRAGTYTVEIEADSTAYEIQGDSVTVKRGEETLVNISIENATVGTTPSDNSIGKDKPQVDASKAKPSISTSDDPLALAIDRFNKRMRDIHPGDYPYNQPPLTKDELIAYASWNMERDDKLPATCKAGLTKIAKQHRLPENWTIDGFYGETSNGGEPVLAFQIFLQTDDNPAIRMVIRRRFLSPPKDFSLSTATNDQGVTSLAAAVKRFNARHSQAVTIEQPSLTEDEVVAAVLYTKARRDDHDVSDALFERFQNIARTRQLPEGATLEVIPTFGVEGGSTYTIWSIRLTMLQDEPDIFGRTYGFLIREQFVSVKHGDAGSIHWGKPAENGLQAGVRLFPPLDSYQLGQKISVEILFRNILTKPISTSVPNFPSYEVEACDTEGTKLQVAVPQLQIVGGWRLETIGDQPISLRGWPIVFLPSSASFEERAKMRSQDDDQVVVFVDPGKSCRVRLTVSNYANDAKGTLTTGEVDFAVDALDSKGVVNGWPVPDTIEMPSFPKKLHGKWRIKNATTLTTKITEFIDQMAVIDQNTVLLPSSDQGTQYRLSHWMPRDDNQSIEVDLTMESNDGKDSKTYRCLLEIHGDELILLRQQNERFSRPKSVDDISTSITQFTLTREQTENEPMVYSPLEAIEVAKQFANVDHGKSIRVKFRVESVHPPFVPSEEDEFGHTKSELHLDFRPLPANFKDDQFLVVLTPEAITQLNKLGISDIEKHFLHKEVEAHGCVLSTMYTARGMPGEHFHLIVSDLQQIVFSKGETR